MKLKVGQTYLYNCITGYRQDMHNKRVKLEDIPPRPDPDVAQMYKCRFLDGGDGSIESLYEEELVELAEKRNFTAPNAKNRPEGL